MSSFRKRLLVLIIGLVVLTQTVTLAAVLASTSRSVEAHAAEQLSAAGSFVDQLMGFRADQLANGVAVLAEDFGFRTAVASGDGPTMLSAAGNNARRIGADLVLLLDTRGHVLASNAPPDARVGAPIGDLLLGRSSGRRDRPQFIVLGRRTYQFFLAPVRTPEIIAWVAMGFAVDDALAHKIRDLAGVQVTLAIRRSTGLTDVASSLPQAERGALHAEADVASSTREAQVVRLEDSSYLTFVQPVNSHGVALEAILQKPMAAVLAPYRELRDSLLGIDGLTLMLAAVIGMILGRSATRPLGELVLAAQRIQLGRYDTAVRVGGGQEFRSLATTFNKMQRTIADREADITRHAYYDSLTGLPNRTLLERRLEDLLAGAERPERLAVILILVRSVQEISATFGQTVGDEVVREAGRRLSRNVATDHMLACLGESRFMVVAPGFSGERARIYIDQLASALRGGFHLSGMTLELTLNAGICVFPDHGTAAGELMQRAQIALEDADSARLGVASYELGRDEQHRRRLTLITGLRAAAERNELTLKYQPKVDMTTRTVKGLEALVRWHHATLGPVSPGEFVPLAESAGASRLLTNWVLGAAVRQLGEWRRSGLIVQVAVNLSAPDILDPDLGDSVLRLLAAERLDPGSLLLEITESAVMRDPELAARHMQPLRAAGLQFAIDDFGTGHSSLSQLSRLPVDELKIDRSFISQAAAGGSAAAIVASTIELAHGMNLSVVAEGVERPDAWNLLKRLGCDCAQGYLISPPIESAAVPAFVSQANRLLPASDSTVAQIRALGQLSGRGTD
ncbi:MAG TPA: EAL domain-containing protein [Steroidobacteraceae bacterium]|nr:EAL domain-containing protein [Steroidobacteraceae bacterium]